MSSNESEIGNTLNRYIESSVYDLNEAVQLRVTYHS